MAKPKIVNTVHATKEEEACRCPACAGDDLVCAYIPSSFGLVWRKGARCLVCGERFAVDAKMVTDLRQPMLGEPHEIFTDRYKYMLSMRMGTLHIVVCLGGLLVGLVLGGSLALRFDEPFLVVVFFPIMCLAWWFGRWLHPPVERLPGKCLNCRYDLRGLTVARCPECGTPFEVKQVHDEKKEASE